MSLFGAHINTAGRKLMKRSEPEELKEITDGLNVSSQMKSLEFWAMGWVAEVEIKKRIFKLVSDRGYIDAYEIVGSSEQHLFPPADQRTNNSNTGQKPNGRGSTMKNQGCANKALDAIRYSRSASTALASVLR